MSVEAETSESFAPRRRGGRGGLLSLPKFGLEREGREREENPSAKTGGGKRERGEGSLLPPSLNVVVPPFAVTLRRAALLFYCDRVGMSDAGGDEKEEEEEKALYE